MSRCPTPRPRFLTVATALLLLLHAGIAAAAPASDAVEEIRAAIRAARFTEAEAAARKALIEDPAGAPRDSLTTATLIDLLVESLWRGGKAGLAETDSLGRFVTGLRERRQGGAHPDLARSLLNLGNVYLLRGVFDRARPLYERSLAIREAALGPDHADVGATLNNLANLERVTGRLDVALALFERALAVRTRALGPTHPDVGATLNNLGIVLMLTGDLESARRRFVRAVELGESSTPPNRTLVLQAQVNIGIVSRELADYAASRRAYERALSLCEEVYGPGHPEIAQLLNNLGVLHEQMGDFEEARERHRQALAIRETAWGADHREVAESLVNFAASTGETDDVAEAIACARRGIAIYEQTIGAGHADHARALTILALLEMRLGRNVEAGQRLERAREIFVQALGPDHYELARVHGRLGQLACFSGDPVTGRRHLERAVTLYERQLGPDHPACVEDRRELARARLQMGDVDAALTTSLDGEAIARRHLALTTRFLAEREALRYAARLAGNLDVALAAGLRRPDPPTIRRLWDAQIRSRAVVFDALAERHARAPGRGSGAPDTLQARFLTASTRLANLLVRGPGGSKSAEYAGTIRRAMTEREVAERALGTRSGSAPAPGIAAGAGLDSVLAALPPGSALVAFSRYGAGAGATWTSEDAALVAFVGRGGAVPVAVPLGAEAAIDSLTRRWRRLALAGAGTDPDSAAEAECRASGEALRLVVWDPLRSHIRGVDRIFLVPEGCLHLVNFGALPADDGRFLLEAGPLFHLLSTERDLLPAAHGPPGSGGLLVVGDPDYDDRAAGHARSRSVPVRYRGPRSGCAEFERLRFERLPATRREAEEVRRLWRRREGGRADLALFGAAAGEARIKREMSGRRVLHLATHGFFLGGACSAGPGRHRGIGGLQVEGDARPTGAITHPLRLAGLALAGANRRAESPPDAEDGILSADEIAALDLTGVEWGVLSACDTGTGDVATGEGVFGLRRAFQLAGAATVIMSLWPVEDEAARDWMTALYTARLIDRLPTAESVRAASLALLRDRRSRGQDTRPSTWAAFLATGDWR